MALALGLGAYSSLLACDTYLQFALGSLFNHSQKPNVSYTIDPCTESIRYVTSRQIMPDEEMCIFYGHKLWFDPVDAADNVLVEPKEEQDDGWGGLTGVEDQDIESEGALTVLDAFSDGDPNEVIPEEQLPFKRIRLTPDEEEEEDMDAVRRGEHFQSLVSAKPSWRISQRTHG